MHHFNKMAILLLAAAMVNSASSKTNHNNMEELTEQAQAKASVFAQRLKQALMTAVQSGGFENGVNVCKDQAPKIAEQLSVDGWHLARTSLKTRNSDNAPDSWESSMLVLFEAELKAGKPLASLNATALNDNQFRYMKAIPTGKLCLACHGQNIQPSLSESINKTYPNDRATGFTLNDIRGAFTLTKSLDE